MPLNLTFYNFFLTKKKTPLVVIFVSIFFFLFKGKWGGGIREIKMWRVNEFEFSPPTRPLPINLNYSSHSLFMLWCNSWAIIHAYHFSLTTYLHYTTLAKCEPQLSFYSLFLKNNLTKNISLSMNSDVHLTFF